MNRRLHRGMIVAVWLITIFEALSLGMAGVAKFSSDAWGRMFVEWGFPAWFALAVGASEILGALLLLIPRTAMAGSLLLATIMLGALVTELLHPQLNWVVPMLHLGLLTALLFLRRRSPKE